MGILKSLILLFIFLNVTQLEAKVLTFYISPTGGSYTNARGKVINSGFNSTRPLKRLEDVHRSLIKNYTTDITDVIVNIKPGVYYGQTVRWKFTKSHMNILFRPWPGYKGQPHFTGRSGRSAKYAKNFTFFILDHQHAKSKQMTNMSFVGLRVTYYLRALLLYGNDENINGYVANNEVRDCDFGYIGEKYTKEDNPGFAAISIINGRNNTFVRNYFSEINNTLQPELIHALYFAHGSSLNVAYYNFFNRTSGAAVNFRNRSNYNKVNQNIFRYGGYGRNGVTGGNVNEWHQRGETSLKECPSVGNTLRYNRYTRKGYMNTNLKLFTQIDVGNPKSYCKTPNGSSYYNISRFRTYRNKDITNWSWSQINNLWQIWNE